MPVLGWLNTTLLAAKKPKHSVINVLRANLAGPQPGRSREHLHASDVTAPGFCPRKWALMDLFEAKPEPEYVSTALAVTYRMGKVTEQTLVEEWAGDHAIGNWWCRRCGDFRSWTPKPGGFCKDGHHHDWEYRQIVIYSDYGIIGSPDVLFNVGSPFLLMVEIKILSAQEFDQIVAPLPEHRIRTNLYLKLMAASNDAYKSKCNLDEARVLYVSRGHGRMNPEWNEILPFKEFVVKRNDADLKLVLQKAQALRRSRAGEGMPSGICATATDKYAKGCSQCAACFSGQYPGILKIEDQGVDL